MRSTPDLFHKLVESIAPTILGHQDNKKAILLMLLGDVHKFTHQGINWKRDINGDPGYAKSQFLKTKLLIYFLYSNLQGILQV